MTEMVFLTAVVDAWENQNIEVMDLRHAFIQADMDDVVHVTFSGEIDYEMYSPFVVEEKGVWVLHIELHKQLYRMLKAAQLFWEKQCEKLINESNFTPNKDDKCVVNKMVGGKQLAVAWPVHDLKVSHVDASVIEKFEQEFGKEGISHGKVHNYLRLTLDFTEPGHVVIQMSDYVNTMLSDAPDEMDGKSLTPAASHLFKVNNVDPELLPQDQKEIFMHLVMQGLASEVVLTLGQKFHSYAESLTVPTGMIKKVIRLICHLRETVYMALVLGMDASNCQLWLIDASLVVHPYMHHKEQSCLWGMGQSSVAPGNKVGVKELN